MKGPKGQMKYTPDLAAHIGMIAGGTGITPMLVSESDQTGHDGKLTSPRPAANYQSRPPKSFGYHQVVACLC